MGISLFTTRTSTMGKCTIFLASSLMIVPLLSMEVSAEPVPEPVAKADPEDFVLVPLDRSYGDNKEDSGPMFRSAFPELDDYADGQSVLPNFRSSLPKTAGDAVENHGKLGVGWKAQPEFRSGCCQKVKVHYSSSAYCSSSYGPRYEHNRLYGSNPGYFIKMSWTINGKVWYKSGNGQYAIWYAKNPNGQWSVGKLSNLGRARSYAYADAEDNCPEDIYWTWKYWNGQWKDANKCLSIYCV